MLSRTEGSADGGLEADALVLNGCFVVVPSGPETVCYWIRIQNVRYCSPLSRDGRFFAHGPCPSAGLAGCCVVMDPTPHFVRSATCSYSTGQATETRVACETATPQPGISFVWQATAP
jgi:hypothetical protein